MANEGPPNVTDPDRTASDGDRSPVRPGRLPTPAGFLSKAAPVPTARDQSRRRLGIAMVSALLAIHVSLAWVSRPPGILLGQDDVEYIVLAQSLREGSYRDSFTIDSPVHGQYPPGYPALLALWGRPFGDRYDPLVALSVVFSAATVLLAFAAGRRVIGMPGALIAAAVLAVNPAMIEMAGRIRSEPAFTFTSLAALYALLRVSDAAHGPGIRRWLALAGGLAIASLSIRIIGIALLAAVGLCWLIERRWRALATISAISAAPLVAWLLWTFHASGRFAGSSYVAESRLLLTGGAWRPALPARAFDSLRDYVTRAIPYHLGVPTIAGTPLDNILVFCLLAVLSIAGLVALRKRWPGALLYLGLYGTVLLLWLWAVDRFVIPIVPLLVLVLFAGALSIASRARPSMRVIAVVPVAILLIAGSLARVLPAALVGIRCDRSGHLPWRECVTPAQADYLDAIAWIGERTPSDAILLAGKPGAVFWYTGRRSVSFPESLSKDTASFVPFLRSKGATHVLLGDVAFDPETRLLQRVVASCSQLRVEAAFAKAMVFAVRPMGETPSLAACEIIGRFTGEAASGRDGRSDRRSSS